LIIGPAVSHAAHLLRADRCFVFRKKDQRDDLAEYFDYWDRLRRAGGAVAGDIQALDRRSTETDMLVMGRAAITFQNSNQLVACQAVVQNRLGMTMFPQGQRPGQYYKPSMLMSMSTNTQQAREVADFAYHAAGGTAVFTRQAFERRFRDVHTVAQQLQGRDDHFENVGKFLLDLTPDTTFL